MAIYFYHYVIFNICGRERRNIDTTRNVFLNGEKRENKRIKITCFF